MAEKKKTVLIISFYFPPNNTIGAVRIGKFAKYLSEFGWKPVVLTVDKVYGLTKTLPLELDEKVIIRTPYRTFYEPFPQRLIGKEDGSSKDVNRLKNKTNLNLKEVVSNCIRLARPIYTSPFINRLLFEPMGWYRYAVRAGLRAMQNDQIDIIFSSFGPTVDHIIAAQLHKHTKVPWVAEFRDEWSRSHPIPFNFFDEQWERRTLKKSRLLISVTPTLVRQLASFHSKRTILITNGFDEPDYKRDVIPTPRLSITYTGSIYPRRRDPSPIFQALAQLRAKELISPKDIEMRFFGDNVKIYIPSVAEKYGVLDFVKIEGNIAFKESIKKQMESSVLLSLEWNDPDGSGTYTGKIFEYIGARKPILALGFKGGDIDNLLRETGCGVMTNNVTEIESILLVWLQEFRTRKKLSSYYHPDEVVIKKYTRREQTKKLAQIFDEVLSPSHLT